MSAINSFFTNANAASYIETLFSSPKATTTTASTGQSSVNRYGVDASGQTATERALSRIIEILTLGGEDGSSSASIDEDLGYVTAGTGTEGNDTLTMTGRGVSNVDTSAGDDSLTVKSESISGVTMGDGADTLKAWGAFVGAIDGGDGNDDLQMKASLAMDIAGGAGDDTIKIAADTIVGLDGGDGNDALTLEGNRIFATGGAGNDTVSIKTTGNDAEVQYTFGKDGGQDKVTANGPLSINLGGLTEKDVTLTVSGNTLTAAINGTEDSISITLDGKTSASSYSFAGENGQTLLKIG